MRALELELLGSLLLAPEDAEPVLRWVGREDFTDDRVWAALQAVEASGSDSLLELAADLEAAGVPEPSVLVAEIASAASPGTDRVRLAQRVREASLRRQLGRVHAVLAEDPESASARRALAALQAELEAAREGLPRARTRAGAPVVVPLSTVTLERVTWLWEGRIPAGKLTALIGDPGLGKSSVTCDLAARVSTGRPMPDGAPGLAGGVVLLSAEDGLGDTIRPRLEAAGADLARVVALAAIRTGDSDRLPEIPLDLEAIAETVQRVEARLVVVDPIAAYLGGDVDSHRDQDSRRALAPLARIAETTGAAVLFVQHLNKAAGANALYRAVGSIGFMAAARAALLVARDPDDDARRVLAHVKSNLGAPAPSLGFRLVGDERTGAAAVEWLGVTEHAAVALLGAPIDAEGRSSAEEARQFLALALRDGPRPAREVLAEARAAGISEKRLERARAALGVRSRRVGYGDSGRWVWCVASAHRPRIEPLDPEPQGPGPLGSMSGSMGDAPPVEMP